MEIRQGVSREGFKRLDTRSLRETFMIEDLFSVGSVKLGYSHIDRIIVGGLIATVQGSELVAGDELRAAYFLERREMGVINLGGVGCIVADGKEYRMGRHDCLYLGRGTKRVFFRSESDADPAVFYMNSCPAHKEYPCALISKADAVHADLGSKESCNERTINKYILPGKVQSCQLVMGLTELKPGSVWNTMPSHTHERRMEVYLYTEIAPGNVVFHFMGDPKETRHVVIENRQAVISPSFSIHSGCGTSNYSFVWGMCGENQDFDDMDGFANTEIR